jgi:hypothetical protein
MQELTGVFVTDGVSRSGECFPIPALEDMLWQSYGKGTPANISHDIHRPLGISRVSSLYVSHEEAYVLGVDNKADFRQSGFEKGASGRLFQR